jgi:hypothetical protein
VNILNFKKEAKDESMKVFFEELGLESVKELDDRRVNFVKVNV